MESFGYVFATEEGGLLGEDYETQAQSGALLPNGLNHEIEDNSGVGLAVLCSGHVGEDDHISFSDGAEDISVWRGSAYRLVRAPINELVRMSKMIGKTDKNGVKLISMRAAVKFPSTHFVPVSYEGSDTAPSMLLRLQGDFEYLIPVQDGSASGEFLASFHRSEWHVDHEDKLVEKTDESKMAELSAAGFVEAVPNDRMLGIGRFDEEKKCLMVRRTLSKHRGEMFRFSAAQQSNTDESSETHATEAAPQVPQVVTKSFGSPRRKKPKTEK